MKGHATLMSRATDEWTTPRAFFEELNERFDFDLDVAATHTNHLAPYYFTAESSALDHEWNHAWCRTAFMNPPYSKCRQFIARAANQAFTWGMTVVALVPARTDTRWFHWWIYNQPGVSIEFLQGRLRFGDQKNGAPFPSMVIVFHGPQMIDPEPEPKPKTKRAARCAHTGDLYP